MFFFFFFENKYKFLFRLMENDEIELLDKIKYIMYKRSDIGMEDLVLKFKEVVVG